MIPNMLVSHPEDGSRLHLVESRFSRIMAEAPVSPGPVSSPVAEVWRPRIGELQNGVRATCS